MKINYRRKVKFRIKTPPPTRIITPDSMYDRSREKNKLKKLVERIMYEENKEYGEKFSTM